jgi:hypothetical protein
VILDNNYNCLYDKVVDTRKKQRIKGNKEGRKEECEEKKEARKQVLYLHT